MNANVIQCKTALAYLRRILLVWGDFVRRVLLDYSCIANLTSA